MSARHPLAALQAQGVLVSFDHGEIGLRAPGGVLEAGALALARAHKALIAGCLGEIAASFGVRELTSGPLSREQQRLFFLHKRHERATEQGISLALAFSGPGAPAPGALAQAARQMPMLQSVIVERPEPQVIWISAGLRCPERLVDLRHVSDGPRLRATVRRLLQHDIARPFALDKEPGIRALRILTPSQGQVLHLMRHHLFSDGWSLGLILNSLQAASDRLTDPRPQPPAPRRSVYLEHACRQRLAPQRPVGEAAPSAVPSGRFFAPQRERARAGLVRMSLCGASLDRLRRQAGVSVFVAAAAKVSVLLSARFSRNALLLGVDVTTRLTPEDDACVGTYVNRAPLAVDVPDRGDLHALLRVVQGDVHDLVARSDRPFQDLVRPGRADAGNAYDPVFDVLFGLHPEPRHAPYRHIGNVTLLDTPDLATHVPLSLYLTVDGSRLHCEIRHDEACLPPPEARALADAFAALLQSEAADIGALRRLCVSALARGRGRVSFKAARAGKERALG